MQCYCNVIRGEITKDVRNVSINVARGIIFNYYKLSVRLHLLSTGAQGFIVQCSVFSVQYVSGKMLNAPDDWIVRCEV